ncbi:hypothetical protein [Methylobacterium sp. Leaf118]|uniref:hypothetical protein n=1 Tax=Methylobacterium sp. Leaf118 TaxID=2876562 RepID=UPI001E34AA3C|nr:hypothetical protein [Methylobacterium sp. Leaf118]
MIRFAVAIVVAVPAFLTLSAAQAFEQPPITSPQDKACRDEATARVLHAPDPQNLGLHAIGREIYGTCMRRAQAAGPGRTARRTRVAAGR